ncbi:MAG: mobile mystery protein B [Candidatus Omnitrophota bacterium]
MIQKFDIPPGATPLEPDELAGLRLTHITTKAELDRWEQDNINDALDWIPRRRGRDVLSETFLRALHKRMFGKVWTWAGQYRRSDKNIGVHWVRIAEEVKKLLDDVTYWSDHQTYSEDEIAARFHHRLVWIHAFVNGNGRHARLAADVLLKETFQRPAFSWSGAEINVTSDIRRQYINALRDADRGEYGPLLNFVRM